MSSLTSRLASLKVFGSKIQDEDDKGEETTSATVAGGGHGARQTNITHNHLRVSHALKSFLAAQGVISEADVGPDGESVPSHAVQALLDKPHISVPSYLTDRSHPLPEYFISSSHNTYLMAHQLFGASSSSAYETALNSGSRCVEIDAWDNDDDPNEPKVTHGYTLVSHITFRSVCEIIRDYYDKEAQEAVDEQGYRSAPVLISLENHCGVQGQLRLAQIMKEVWGDRLLSEAVRQEGHDEQDGGDGHVNLDQLGSKIVVIVEHHLAGEAGDVDDSDTEGEDEEQKQAKKVYREKEKAAATTTIIPELAELGVYAQSVKPRDNSWYEELELTNGPHHHLINVSESGLASHMVAAAEKIGRHNSQHLMRVFPKGTRISSKNLNPVPFWGVGAQICALNWQTFGASMQLNEALFSGSDGYVLKPNALRTGGSGKLSTGRTKRLRLHIGGASEIPLPESKDHEDIKPYVTCVLVHPDNYADDPPKRKTAAYRRHKFTSFLHKGENPPANDPIFDQVLEWEFEENELVFVRILIKSDDSFTANPVFAVAAVRLSYVVPGWSFVRMLDLKGSETKCSLLVKFDVEDA